MIFIHGLVSSGRGFKARLLRKLFPGIQTPDFTGPLEARMQQLRAILGDQAGWTMIGSSFGGLMAAIYACRHPERVSKLILFAPALIHPAFSSPVPSPVSIPTVVYHGEKDSVVPLAPVRVLCEQVFLELAFHAVDDDHRLHKTVQAIDWRSLVGEL
ncbi:MAG: alpha/beta fold hydrolase [Anaerolineales bacterium]|jgi:pimeloyl-ACP methyl ester carboxylesterase